LAALLELAMCAFFVDLSSQELVDDCSAQVAVSAAAAQPKQVGIGLPLLQEPVFRIRIESGQWIRIRIRIQEGKNYPQK
jgi:hypothetical protein